MAKVDEPTWQGWDEPGRPPASRGPVEGRPKVRQLSLIHIMVAVVYFAILFWLLKLMLDGKGYVPWIISAEMVGLGICAVSLWLIPRLAHFSFIGWGLFVLGYLIMSVAVSFFFALLSFPILIGAILFLCMRRQANNQGALLWVLDVAANRGIPLTPGVEVFSSQVNGLFKVWTRSLAQMLGRGAPLHTALDYIPRLVPRRSSLLIRMGSESGNLALGLREAVVSRETREPIFHAIGGRMAYLGWVSTIGLGIVGFVMYYIVPKFEAIFKDFGVDLPPLTRMVILGSDQAIAYSWVVPLGILGIVIYAMIGLFGAGESGLPLFDRLFARRHTSLILRSLAVVVSAGRPVAPALDSLSQAYPTAWVRRKLAIAAGDAKDGVGWTEALHENRLLASSDVGVLASAERAGNLAWALRELADTGERRWASRLQVWTQLLFVATMLVLGALTFILAVAFFLPLVTLIEKLST